MNPSSHYGAGTGANWRRVPPFEGYSLWAATYDEEVNPLLALEKRTLEPLLPALQGKSVLDVACGTGRWLEILMRRGARSYVGVDFCAPMLARAAHKPGIRGRLVRADCEALPLRSEFADLAVCSFALGYLPTLDGLANGLAQVIRPRGHVLISDLHPSAYERGWRRSFRTGNGVVEILSRCYSIERVCSELRAHGFEQLKIVEPEFGEQERRIFLSRGKAQLFAEVSGMPAIWLGQFERASRN